ncbi:hypothetical protein G9A89_000364, partial [Geosiphon pyriformis]
VLRMMLGPLVPEVETWSLCTNLSLALVVATTGAKHWKNTRKTLLYLPGPLSWVPHSTILLISGLLAGCMISAFARMALAVAFILANFYLSYSCPACGIFPSSYFAGFKYHCWDGNFFQPFLQASAASGWHMLYLICFSCLAALVNAEGLFLFTQRARVLILEWGIMHVLVGPIRPPSSLVLPCPALPLFGSHHGRCHSYIRMDAPDLTWSHTGPSSGTFREEQGNKGEKPVDLSSRPTPSSLLTKGS